MLTRWTSIAATSMALGIAMGAFGAHGLKDLLSQHEIIIYEKAVFYHLTQSLGVLLISVLPGLSRKHERTARIVCALLTLGVVIFSGSLYLLAITGARWWGAITPIGGSLFIAGWIWLAVRVGNSQVDLASQRGLGRG